MAYMMEWKDVHGERDKNIPVQAQEEEEVGCAPWMLALCSAVPQGSVLA